MTDTRRAVQAAQLAHIHELAERYGLLYHHCHDSRMCSGQPGLPDVIIVGPNGILYRELKSDPRSITSAQTTWKWSLKAAGADWGLWLPSHMRNGTIQQQLATIA